MIKTSPRLAKVRGSVRVQFTPLSGNAKTGPIPVSGSQANTCPDACPFKQDGCYAKYGPIMIHWNRLNKGQSGLLWNDFLKAVRSIWRGSLWRHNQFGDLAQLPGGKVDAKALAELTAANKGRAGFTYTHHEVLKGAAARSNRKAIQAANAGGFAVNLSGNNLEHADKLKALGIAPVVCVVPMDSPKTLLTPGGNRVVVCPAQTTDGITCQRCGFCQRQDRAAIIGFRAHGSGAKYVNAQATPAAA